jgi:hemerythrin-like domain-containing protein
MKRHESIAALSRDHHFGLLFCWKLRQGIKKQVPPERMQPYVKYFWENHLQQHFEEEETLLFNLLNDHLIEQAMSEHKYIEQLVDAIVYAASVQQDQLNVLADKLDNHIRFEERTLFPHMEAALSREKLAVLAVRLQQSHSTPEKDNYADEFWV